MSQSAIDRAALKSLLDSFYDLSKTTENYLKQPDSVENSPNLVEKPLKTTEIEDAGETCEYIAKIVVHYRDSLVSYGMEPNLAGSLAKDLSGRLWSDVLEGEQ